MTNDFHLGATSLTIRSTYEVCAPSPLHELVEHHILDLVPTKIVKIPPVFWSDFAVKYGCEDMWPLSHKIINEVRDR